MTCNTSAVAVCCSSASRVSVISRAFSIAMTACAAKFCNSAICLSVNGRTSWRSATISPSSASSLRSGTDSSVRTPPSSTDAARLPGASIAAMIGDVDEAFAAQATAGRRRVGPARSACAATLGERLRHAAHRDRAEMLAVIEYQARRARPRTELCAFSRIASNTGARSPGEELMTCSTSAVAVCCSSASRVSVISRAFSIAMTACAAKFCNSAICLSVNGRTSWR